MNYLEASATISDCGTYRYDLRRVWDRDKPACLWVMLNPSTADGSQDDPTIRRCVGFADAWGHGGIVVVNLFALRATKPDELRRHSSPVGPANWVYLHKWAKVCPLRLAAWGTWGGFMQRDMAVKADFAERGFALQHLGLTKGGFPKHPLYLPADSQPQSFTESKG